MPKETIGSPSSLDAIFGWLTPWADSPEFIRVLDGCNHPTKILISCFAVYGIAITGEVEHSPNKNNQILNVFPIGPSWAAYWGYSTKKVQLNNQTTKSYLRHQSTETPWGFHFMHDADTTQLVQPHESWPCALGIAQVILLPLGALFSFNLLGSLHFCYKAPFFSIKMAYPNRISIVSAHMPHFKHRRWFGRTHTCHKSPVSCFCWTISLSLSHVYTHTV